MEWTFLETCPDYEKLQKLQLNNHTFAPKSYEQRSRIRFYCNGRRAHNCEFMLLALKTKTEGYHVYKHGKHNHAAFESRGK
jgi:hypothetical protein